MVSQEAIRRCGTHAEFVRHRESRLGSSRTPNPVEIVELVENAHIEQVVEHETNQEPEGTLETTSREVTALSSVSLVARNDLVVERVEHEYPLASPYTYEQFMQLTDECFAEGQRIEVSARHREMTDGEVDPADIRDSVIRNMRPGDRFLDVGSGSGMIVLQAAMTSVGIISAKGIEIFEQRADNDGYARTRDHLSSYFQTEIIIGNILDHLDLFSEHEVVFINNIAFSTEDTNRITSALASHGTFIRLYFTTVAICPRGHKNYCTNPFCQVYEYVETFQVNGFWTHNDVELYLYKRRSE